MKRVVSALLLTFALASSAHGQTLLKLRSGTYDSDAQAYFNALVANSCTTPSVAFKAAVSAYVVAEKAAGNWGGQDMTYILATADSCTASVNLAQPSLYKITFSGACTFAVATGLTGDASSCNGDTNVQQTSLTRISQNNAHFDICMASAVNNALGSGSTAGRISFSGTSSKASRITSNANITDTGVTSSGCNYAWRTNSTQATTGRNGVVNSNAVASTSAALTTEHIFLCEQNGTFCPATTKMGFVEVGQPLVDEVAHYNNERTMLTTLGFLGL